jgi:hypothetical protein
MTLERAPVEREAILRTIGHIRICRPACDTAIIDVGLRLGAAAALVLWLHIPLPDAVIRPVTLLSDAALPLMILVLGMQLERATAPERPSEPCASCVSPSRTEPVGSIAFAQP